MSEAIEVQDIEPKQEAQEAPQEAPKEEPKETPKAPKLPEITPEEPPAPKKRGRPFGAKTVNRKKESAPAPTPAAAPEITLDSFRNDIRMNDVIAHYYQSKQAAKTLQTRQLFQNNFLQL